MTLDTRSNGDKIIAPWFNEIKTEVEANDTAQTAALGATTATSSDDFAIGDGTDTTKSITANNADANKPKLRYNHTSNAWEFSNDGTSFSGIGASGGGLTVVTKSTSATLSTAGEDIVLVDATSGDVTLTLPAASGNSGLTYRVVKIDSSSNKVILDGNGSETINDNLTLELYGQYNEVQTSCDGTEYFTISGPSNQTAIIRDEKPDTTASGTFTSGSWQTRTLNAISGQSDFVVLSANSFTLPFGVYYISGNAQAQKVGPHRTKIRNTTDSTDAILGENAYNIGVETTTASPFEGVITITDTKTFQLQHRCNTTRASDGLGVASSFGVVEIYAELTIVKIK